MKFSEPVPFCSGMLVGGSDGQIHYINYVAAHILREVISDPFPCASAAILKRFQDRFGTSDTEARRSIDAVMDWMNSVAQDGQRGSTNNSIDGLALQGPDHSPDPSGLSGEEVCLRINQELIRVIVDDTAVLDLLRPMLAHLEFAASTDEAQKEVWLRGSSAVGRYALCINGELMDCAHDVFTARHLTLEGLALASTPERRCFALLHAAAVQYRGTGIAMFGPSGSGKTSLLLGLAADGADFISDDLVPITGTDGRAVPVPFAIGAKSGNWELARSLFPRIDALPTVELGERRVKYLEPSPACLNICTEPYPIGLMLLPSFSPGASPEIQILEPPEALAAAADAGSWFDGETEQIKLLASFFERTRTAQIRYGSQSEAHRLVDHLIGDLQ